MTSSMQVLVVVLVVMVTASANTATMMNMVNSYLKNAKAGSNTNTVRVNIDQGSLRPCTASDPKFTFNWTPKKIKIGDTVSVNFDMVPTVDFSSGTLHGSVMLPDYPDPIYEGSLPIDCTFIHKIFKNFCPFHKGEKDIHLKDYKVFVPNKVPLPDGTFILHAKITNKNGELLACLNGTVEVAQPDYDYPDYGDYY